MGETGSNEPTVLVVEDEDHVAELFETVLSATYDVVRASTGVEALEQVEAFAQTDETIDIALLDRRMPQMTGDELLQELETRDIDCRVAMISGVDPDFDVIELGFDDYLLKPVTNEQLHETVERLLALDEYEQLYQRLSSKRVKKSVLEVEKTPAELDRSDRFQQLRREIRELETKLARMETDQDFDERQLPT